MKLIQAFLFFILTFVLTACVPKIHKQAMIKTSLTSHELKQDIRLQNGVKTLLPKQWWRVYEDMQLDNILAKVLNSSPKLEEVKTRYEHANAVINSLNSSNLPQVSLNSSAQRERISSNYIFPPPLGGSTVSLFELNTQVHYEFDFWHKRRSRILAAKYGALSQKNYIKEIKLLLSSAVCKFYLSWYYEDKSIKILHILKDTILKEKNILIAQKQHGLTNASNIYKIDAKIEIINQQIQAHELIIDGLKENIAILGGFLPSFLDTLHVPKIRQHFIMPFPKKVYLNMLSNRPDIAVQKYIVMSYNEKIKEAKARFYPNINLEALIGYTTLDFAKFLTYSSIAPTAGVAFSLPLFENGARKANLHIQVSKYNSAVYAYNNLVIKAINQTVSILKKQHSLSLQRDALKDELKALKNKYLIAKGRFQAGLTNLLPILAVKRYLLHVKLENITLLQERALLQINLIEALGGGKKKYARTK